MEGNQRKNEKENKKKKEETERTRKTDWRENGGKNKETKGIYKEEKMDGNK